MFTKTDAYFLTAASLSLFASVALWFLYARDYGLFVGLWVPSILALWIGVKMTVLSLQDRARGSNRS